jgi:soluble lytic murein transglycosylase-like protein
MKRSAKTVRLGGFLVLLAAPAVAKQPFVSADLAQLTARHAGEYQVPEELVYRVIERESGFDPKLHHRAYWGLMQISGATARSMGYRGPLAGLLDADTNLSYGMPYLANAYIVAHGDQRRAIMLYSRGYYLEAKRKGLLGALRTAASTIPVPEPSPAAAEPPPRPSLVDIVRNLLTK